MHYDRVHIDAIGFVLPPEVVTTRHLESQLAPLYHRLNIPKDQVESLTGVRERRFWPRGAGLASGAAAAARRALQAADVGINDIGAIIYAGVCREHLEPATACAVAAELNAGSETIVADVANACLGVLTGMINVANHIQLGHIRAGLIVSCESAREINEETIRQLLDSGDRARYSAALATFTGGSGAVAVLLTDGSFPGGARHRLLGGVLRAAPEHHELCQWGYRASGEPGQYTAVAHTDAPAVLRHGVELGHRTWQAFLAEMNWRAADVDRCISHQIGRAHRQQMLDALGIAHDRDFPTYAFLGNMGSVSVPLTAAIAEERGQLNHGDRVGLLGIGSGLNCMMLGVEW